MFHASEDAMLNYTSMGSIRVRILLAFVWLIINMVTRTEDGHPSPLALEFSS